MLRDKQERMAEIEKEAFVSGTQVNYYNVCKTKLWLFSHFIHMEHHSEDVRLGRLLHQQAFKREKEASIDQKIVIDFVKKGKEVELHEIKKSFALQKAHAWQLLYYLYYLKKNKGVSCTKGFIIYPLQRKRVEVRLTQAKERELLRMLEEIQCIVSSPTAPKKEWKRFCRKCGYFEFCWSE